MADAENRAQLELDDSWQLGLKVESLNVALGELEWLMAHSNIREYLLVRQTPRDTPYVDPLDDSLPF